MLVRKRDGRMESIRFDKIVNRVEQQSYGLNTDYVQPHTVALKVFNGLYDGVPSIEIDNLIAETSASLTTHHPDYSTLAARIAVTNLHKSTAKSFYSTMKQLYHNNDPKTGTSAPLLSRSAFKFIQEHAAQLDEAIIHARDFTYDYFGIRTLQSGYLMRVNGQIAERPQHMLMRVAVGVHTGDVESVIETYNLLSEKWYTHATPTLFNAATPKPQMSSCFLLTMKDDSIDGIYDTLKQCAKISQSAGGIGLSVSHIRAKGSYIKGTGGTSNGLVPMLRNFDMTARYVDQGGGKRKGSIAIYIEPWHADIEDILDMKLNHGKEELRARDLFYALWIPDLLMKRVEDDDSWTLFCPNEAPGLMDVHSGDFEKLYTHYERAGKARRVVPARALWEHILKVQQETGQPFVLFKDAANRKSNQQNLGTIRSSNLCTEIIEYSSPGEVAVCNLASINLPKFVKDRAFDHNELYQVTYRVTVNLNKLIDNNHYPVEEAKNSNIKHRPIGIGVQGLADVFIKLDMAFESEEARQLNRDIFETIYFAALTASKD
ncbi:MAG: ribonucleoside-diphosphate reductase subunit alpha, partial [Cytophagales bacterium]|nr:ribonucleoside-diphosphate reductase subunit alpha [Cytophagales bacterium]